MFLLFVFPTMMQAPAPPSMPKILLIAREPIRPGAEAGYDRIESDTGRLAAKFSCPHPYLALEPLSGAKNEVWWLNWFDSRKEMDSVGEAYKKSEAWNAVLTKNQKLKERLTGKVVEQLATSHRPTRNLGQPEERGMSWSRSIRRRICAAAMSLKMRWRAVRDPDDEHAPRSGAGSARE